jgi:catalase
MLVTVAQPGDPTSDPSQAWPDYRQHVDVGTVVIESSTPQDTGACRDINYDPLVLPTGVTGSDDPILAARSAVYAVSFNRREHDIATGEAAAATGDAKARERRP